MQKNNQIFKGDLYNISDSESHYLSSFCYSVSLNPGHKIYKAHFPGNPITPGACVVQIATELLSEHLSKEMILSEAKNIKFIKLINPLENGDVDFVFKTVTLEDDSVNASICVCKESLIFVKISALFTEEKNAGEN